MEILRIYTDGACSGNQNEENIGGWGAILEFEDKIKEIHGGELNTTNNRMEMTALLRAFESLKTNRYPIEVFADSSYLINCFKQKWYKKWQQNGWLSTAGSPVENQDLWEKLLSHIEKYSITFFKVKGHVNLDHPNTDVAKHFAKFTKFNGDKYDMEMFCHATKMNNRADKLANIGMEELR